MAIEINSFFGGICNSVYSATGLNNIFSSVAYTSILLSCIIITMILLMYPCKKDAPTWLVFKMFLYILIASAAVFSIHSNFIRNNYKEKYLNNNVSTLMHNIHGGAVYGDEKVKVSPSFEQTYEKEYSHDYEQDYKYGSNQSNRPSSVSDVLDDLERRI